MPHSPMPASMAASALAATVTVATTIASLVGGLTFAAVPARAQIADVVTDPEAQQPQRDPIVVVVSLGRQKLAVHGAKGKIAEAPISSGTRADPTPTGIFSVIGKAVDHESNLYLGAKMPFMQRLTWTGTALHAGHLPGYPASHGCIRMPKAFSERLYDMTVINSRVVVTAGDVAPAPIDHAKLFQPQKPDPSLKPVGPVSIPIPRRMPGRATAAAVYRPARPVYNGVVPLTFQARARFEETARLFAAIAPADEARAALWERIKVSNRALAIARADLERHDGETSRVAGAVERLQRSRRSTEGELTTIMTKAERTRRVEAFDTLARAGTTADSRLYEVTTSLEAAEEQLADLKLRRADIEARLTVAENDRRSLNDTMRDTVRSLRNAQAAFRQSQLEDIRYMKPVSVFVSRADRRIYIRQGFEPVIDLPIEIADPERPLGTHLYTAMAASADGAKVSWTALSFGATGASPPAEPERKGKAAKTRGKPSAAPAVPASNAAMAAQALDRLTFPKEALDAIAERMKPGSSLIIADAGTSTYFGNGTDFIVDVP